MAFVVSLSTEFSSFSAVTIVCGRSVRLVFCPFGSVAVNVIVATVPFPVFPLSESAAPKAYEILPDASSIFFSNSIGC